MRGKRCVFALSLFFFWILNSWIPSHENPSSFVIRHSSLLMLSPTQCLFQIRVSDRKQRPLFELTGKKGQPDTAETDRRCEIHPVNSNGLRAERGRDQPEEIDKTHHDDRCSEAPQQAGSPFEV